MNDKVTTFDGKEWLIKDRRESDRRFVLLRIPFTECT